jgi:ethanolamine ammonia-lyase large subunit
VDLVFQSIGGTEAANRSFGISAGLLDEARAAALALGAARVGNNVMYFETGQGSALSANAHHGVDQQTCEARAYGVARASSRAGEHRGRLHRAGIPLRRQADHPRRLEDHFCGKLLGLPMGCDICYTNHAEADQDDMDTLLTLLGVAGINFIIGVPGADDIMLNYQSTSFHDALYLRQVLGRRRAPSSRPGWSAWALPTPRRSAAPGERRPCWPGAAVRGGAAGSPPSSPPTPGCACGRPWRLGRAG